MNYLAAPLDGAVVSVMTDVQREFRRRQNEDGYAQIEKPFEWIDRTLERGRKMSSPAKVIFRWKSDDPSKACALELSESADFAALATYADVQTAYADAGEDGAYFCPVGNLKSGTTYYWRVSEGGADDKECARTEIRSFTTAAGEMRAIDAGGLANVRDLGGWKTDSGKYVRQGAIYRGCAVESRVSWQYIIGDVGRRVMHEQLGVRTELDFRREAEGHIKKSPINEEQIEFRLIKTDGYEKILSDEQREYTKEIFELFADESKYPIYFHCQAGADRTGTMSILLLSLLGVSLEDIIFDYEMGALAVNDKRSWYHNGDLVYLRNFLAEKFPHCTSMQQTMVEYLRWCGVSDETLEKIRAQMLV